MKKNFADAYLKGAPDVRFESLALPERNRVLLRMGGKWREYMTIPDAAADDTIQIIKLSEIPWFGKWAVILQAERTQTAFFTPRLLLGHPA
ncbi:MAG: hypothetical protein HKO68_13560 [Desulfobacterales bacterium]|nr:hypothetical protein [Desulfobacterales bacterium]